MSSEALRYAGLRIRQDVDGFDSLRLSTEIETLLATNVPILKFTSDRELAAKYVRFAKPKTPARPPRPSSTPSQQTSTQPETTPVPELNPPQQVPQNISPPVSSEAIPSSTEPDDSVVVVESVPGQSSPVEEVLPAAILASLATEDSATLPMAMSAEPVPSVSGVNSLEVNIETLPYTQRGAAREARVEAMIKETGRSKDECFFFLESAAWNLKDAIELIRSLDIR